MTKRRPTAEGGFTLVELIIAMAIFSFMLLIITVGVLSLFRIYEAGGQIRNTQRNTRLVSQDINDDIHTSLGSQYSPATVAGYPQDTLCLFNILQTGVAPSGSGVVYFAVSSGPSSYQLHKRTFKYMPTTSCFSGPNAMYPLLTFGPDQKLTDDTVSVAVLEVVTKPDPAYVGLNISIIPVAALGGSPLVNLTTHPYPTCLENFGTQYCSITNLTLGGTTHTETEN